MVQEIPLGNVSRSIQVLSVRPQCCKLSEDRIPTHYSHLPRGWSEIKPQRLTRVNDDEFETWLQKNYGQHGRMVQNRRDVY